MRYAHKFRVELKLSKSSMKSILYLISITNVITNTHLNVDILAVYHYIVSFTFQGFNIRSSLEY